MKRIAFATIACVLALTAPARAQASTDISVGSYSAGDSVFVDDTVALGPGTYLFTLTLSAPANGVEGQVEKLTNYVDYCDMDGSGTAVYCGSDDTPSIPLLEPVSATVFQAMLRVDAPYSVYYNAIDHTDYTDSCCTYQFDFQAITNGTYAFSFAAVPEPATWMLMVLGFGLLGAVVRRRRSSSFRFEPA